MTPNEINLIKTFTELLEQKNEKILELSLVESEKKINDVKDNWNSRYGDLNDKLEISENRYTHLVERLKENGYISQDIRDELGIVNK